MVYLYFIFSVLIFSTFSATSSTKYLSLCDGIDDRLSFAAHLIDIPDFYISAKEFSSGEICNEPVGHYGYMVESYEIFIFTDIYINDILLNRPNTLYNVLLHEVAHSMGMTHSENFGIMNYYITINSDGSIFEDQRKLWLSSADYFTSG
jgi:hypothetical protein